VYIVLGGQLKALDGAPQFADCKSVEFVGAYATHDEAVLAWRGRAQQTVDNALARYFIVDAQKMLVPAH
jgi:hypothetical protein